MEIKIGEKIKELLEENDMTQRELSKKMNITEAAMSRYIKNERCPRADILINLAKVFNESVENLTNTTVEMSAFPTVMQAVCRHGKELSNEQKQRIIKMLSDDE